MEIAPGVIRFESDYLHLVMTTLVQTSGIVYRFPELATTRFDARLWLADDYLFFVSLMLQAGGVVYRREPTFTMGRGLNISHIEWGDPKGLVDNDNMRTMLIHALAHLKLNGPDRQFAQARLRKTEREICALLLYFLRRGQLRLGCGYMLRRPIVLREMIPILTKIAGRRTV